MEGDPEALDQRSENQAEAEDDKDLTELPRERRAAQGRLASQRCSKQEREPEAGSEGTGSATPRRGRDAASAPAVPPKMSRMQEADLARTLQCCHEARNPRLRATSSTKP